MAWKTGVLDCSPAGHLTGHFPVAASVSPSAEVVALGERGALVARAFLKGGGYLGWGSLSGSERVKITVPPQDLPPGNVVPRVRL